MIVFKSRISHKEIFFSISIGDNLGEAVPALAGDMASECDEIGAS